ncbi:nitroreductase family deazaflavin-dependent oxidoreductase [Ktedonosporobacter rubrisoli]|uniref:Nitroreductase family deazaflavin-dependent oxidoreductase n=2 Tax=Ktedonosporobacter rubrisoli TaxID=2509675 RepID=A0A4P6K5Q2_KTERU|nr:nitroreductase family deazaflavin-dependent oxidoreductase [Ktedonosporobacter rubrisoli]
MQSQKEYNQKVIAEFHANGGKVADFGSTPLILLTTIGAKSGQERITPLAYTIDNDRFILIASDKGSPVHPGWYHNILAQPLVTVETSSERFQARAVVTEEPERSRLFTQMAEQMPAFAEYQERTSRKIPVIALVRLGTTC